MIFYLGNTGKLSDIELLRKHGMGTFLTATGWRTPHPNLRYALDNGAFSAYKNSTRFDDLGYEDFIRRHRDLNTRPDFAVVPDIVAGGHESLGFSMGWRVALKRMVGDFCPWYLAVQDGMTTEMVEPALVRFDGIFIGGSINWKLLNASMWVKFAHKHGMPAHIGRCGIPDRILWAVKIGADSADSTSPARDFKGRLPKILEAIKGEDPQAKLFEDK
jgi:hypothetical protein